MRHCQRFFFATSLMMAVACKKQPAKSSDLNQDLDVTRYANLSSADGRLRSFGVKSEFPACDAEREGFFAFLAIEKTFYRCDGKSYSLLAADSSTEALCRSYNLSVDIANTLGAEASTDVSFLAARCQDGTGYLINKDNGLIPNLMASSYDQLSKTINLRASQVSPKSGGPSSLFFARPLKLPAPVEFKTSALPRSLEIVPGGDASVGQFVYVSFNDGAAMCSYRSVQRESYQLAGCVSGKVEMNKQVDSGMLGDQLIHLSVGSISGVSSVQLLMGSTAVNYITTVDFTVNHN